MGFFSNFFSKKPKRKHPAPAAPKKSSPPLPLEELTRRLKLPLEQLLNTQPTYTELQIPKRSGGTRTLHVPSPELKILQRIINRRLFTSLVPHPCAHGFSPEKSIVTNATPHLNAAVLLRMDIQNFFPSTSTDRVLDFFLGLNWSPEPAAILTKLTTHQNALPQGAPTSPILSNLLNYKLDHRLDALADSLDTDTTYTRYADDLTFSFKKDNRADIAKVIRNTQQILSEFNYKLHTKKKLRIARQHQRMLVTGLVVNKKLNLPRTTRRKLRAIKHHLATGKPATLTPQQLAGWTALQNMLP